MEKEKKSTNSFVNYKEIDHLPKRIGMSVAGVMIGAVCVAFFKMAAFGVDPFQSFMSGLNQLIPMDFGTLYMIVNVLLLSVSLIFDRHYIGVATFVNLFLLGYVTQFSYWILQQIFVSPSMLLRIVFLIFGSVAMCVGSALYMTADLGVSTYDAIAMIIAYTKKIWKFKYVRITTDVICVLLGGGLFLLGGGAWKDVPAFIGVGTILTAFFMGPLIEFFNVTIARPFLYGKNAK